MIIISMQYFGGNGASSKKAGGTNNTNNNGNKPSSAPEEITSATEFRQYMEFSTRTQGAEAVSFDTEEGMIEFRASYKTPKLVDWDGNEKNLSWNTAYKMLEAEGAFDEDFED